MKYHVKWINPEQPRLGKEVIDESILGGFIMSLINDECIVIQCEPVE